MVGILDMADIILKVMKYEPLFLLYKCFNLILINLPADIFAVKSTRSQIQKAFMVGPTLSEYGFILCTGVLLPRHRRADI